jgi:hypothetical protein
VTPSLPRFSGIAAATVAAVCAVGALPTSRLAPDGGLASMAIAAGLVWATALLGYAPVALHVLGTTPEAKAQAWLIGTGLRLFTTLGVLLAGWTGTWVPHRYAFLVWTGALYAVVLVVETVILARGKPLAGDGAGSNGAASA